MQFLDTAGTTGRSAPPRFMAARSEELDELRATCRSQALTIDALGAAVSALRARAQGLKVDNAELRAECARLGRARRGRGRDRFHAGAAPAVRLPCDVRAPGAARIVVAQGLRGRVVADVLDRAQLLVTELVTNSVRHSGARPEDAVIVRVSLWRTTVRLEVEDCGRGGVIAPRLPDLDGGGGFGLQLVQTLSERWGLERAAHGGTLVWAQLARTSLTAPVDSPEPATPAAHQRV